MRIFLALMVVVMISGCASGYQKFYKSEVDGKTSENIELLQPGQEPKVYGTNNFERDSKALFSKGYIRIGYSSFNGSFEDEKKVKAQAKRVGAYIVLIDSKYTNTQSTTSSLFVPNGTYGTLAVPITSHQRRFDQNAIFFAKYTKKLKLGIQIRDLTEAQRIEAERNTGVSIYVVMNNSPAFKANLLPGDIAIEINGTPIRNIQHFLEVLDSMDHSITSAHFKIIRKGKVKDIIIKFE